MKKYFLLLILLFSNAAVSLDLKTTMILGTELTDKVSSGAVTSIKTFGNYPEFSKYFESVKCKEFKYRNYIIEALGKTYLYLVGSKDYNIVIGKHFRAEVKGNAIDMSSIYTSTFTCWDTGPAKLDTVGLFVSSDDEYPNEFHILQSSLHSIGMFVSNPKDTVYSVNGSRIRKVEE